VFGKRVRANFPLNPYSKLKVEVSRVDKVKVPPMLERTLKAEPSHRTNLKLEEAEVKMLKTALRRKLRLKLPNTEDNTLKPLFKPFIKPKLLITLDKM